jgi:hypothetical protein
METSVLNIMIIGMVIIWGGLIVSIAHAVTKAKTSKG